MLTILKKCWRTVLASLLAKAMKSEMTKAGLEANIAKLSFGDIHYLSRISDKKTNVILMVHGAGADKESWLRLAQKISHHYQLIIPDLPGHGESCYDSAHQYGIEQQTKNLIALLQHLGIEKLHVVGSSMGGAIAMRMAYQCPEMVKSLCLIDSAGAESEKAWLQLETLRTGRNPMMEIASVEDYKNMLKIGMSKPPYIPSVFLTLLAQKKIARKIQDAHVMRDILRDLDQRSILASLRLPCLIVWGGLDKIMHVADAALLAEKIQDSQVLIIPDVGHVPMVEAPNLVAARYIHFVESR
jgi:pimeloyl-ACP methyl ester carboxylesterase